MGVAWRIGPYTFKVTKRSFKPDKHNHYGLTRYPECTVRLNTTGNEALDAQTAFHELLHCIFYAHGYHELNDDEILIDTLALHLAENATVS